MGKRVVYLRAHDERELKADGLDPGQWVKDIVRQALEERARKRKEPEPTGAVPHFKTDFKKEKDR